MENVSMADYVTSENGIKIPLSKVEAESVKRLSCPYCQKEFHAVFHVNYLQEY